MSHRNFGLLSTIGAVVVMFLAPPPAAAQQQPYTPLIPCPVKDTKSKRPLTALPDRVIEPKRTSEGWPDLQGTWTSGAYPGGSQDSIESGWDPADIVVRGVCGELTTNTGPQASLLIDPMHGLIPYRPEAQAKRMEDLAAMYAPTKRMEVDVDIRCFPRGVPRASTFGGLELRYMPGAVMISDGFGEHYTWRIIPMDGRPHLSENVKLYMGDSVGHWEGNTLVVETTNNREGTWFDKHASFHSEEMRVVERWTLVDQDTLYYEATITDPTVFTRPWKLASTYDRNKNMNRATQESTCHEGGERFIETVIRTGMRARAAGLKGYALHVDLATGKAIRPEEQKYLDENGQRTSYAPLLPDQAAPDQPPVGPGK